jgi:hypothetical protein
MDRKAIVRVLLVGGDPRECLFYSMPAEKGYRWLPVLQFQECFGTPALTAGELIYVLDQIVKQIRANLTARS